MFGIQPEGDLTPAEVVGNWPYSTYRKYVAYWIENIRREKGIDLLKKDDEDDTPRFWREHGTDSGPFKSWDQEVAHTRG